MDQNDQVVENEIEIDSEQEQIDRGDIVATDDAPENKETEEVSDSLGKDDEKLEDEVEEKDHRIPKSRFDQVRMKAKTRENELLDRIAQLEAAQNKESSRVELSEASAQIAKLEEQYEDLIFEGEKEKARAVRIQINQMRDEVIAHRISDRSDAARQAAVDQLSYQSRLAVVEAQYPALNPDTDSFDEGAANEVLELMNAFVSNGISQTAALNKAVGYVLGEPNPVQAEDRSRRARHKAAEASKKQPPDASKVGIDSDRMGHQGTNNVDISRLTQESFAKLDEETLAQLRGDTV